VPSIIEDTEFEVVQMLLKAHSPAPSAPHVVSGPTLLNGICFRATSGGAITLRNGKSGAVQVLHLLDQGSAGRDWLQTPPRSHGKARQRGSRADRAAPFVAQSSQGSPVGRVVSPEGARRGAHIAECASVLRRRKPNSSGSTTPSKTGSLTSSIRCSRSAQPSCSPSKTMAAPTQSGRGSARSGGAEQNHSTLSKPSPARPPQAHAN